MRRIFRRIGKAAFLMVLSLLAFLLGLSAYHHIRLGAERSKLEPPGERIAVNGHAMHVAGFGDRGEGPTIALLSGSGTAAPVYDFKSLHENLSADYRVVVVERSGYGYSEVSGRSRDVDTVMEETRAALALAGERGPYVLMPHSLSGIEALYYAQTYPEEVMAIVGLDMNIPQSAANIPTIPFADPLLRFAGFAGLQRLPFLCPIESAGLTDAERDQVAYLTYRNAFNLDVRNEIARTQENIAAIDMARIGNVPLLAFVSEDEVTRGEYRSFQALVPCRVIALDAGHYLHRYEGPYIASQTKAFLKELEGKSPGGVAPPTGSAGDGDRPSR